MNALATYPRALQWGPGLATPQPRVKLNTADSGGSTPLQTALAHKTPNRLRKVSPQTVQVLPMSWTKCVTYVLTQPPSLKTQN
jgi:hypothetical protein